MSAQKINNLLLDRYNALDNSEKKLLYSELKSAKGVLKIFQFLDIQGKKYFNTIKALHFIYDTEELKASNAVLENRYYKQRKKILQAIDNVKKTNNTLFTDAETFLSTIERTPCNYSQWQHNLHKLNKIELYLKENEIFELLLRCTEIKIKKCQQFQLPGVQKFLQEYKIYSTLVSAIINIKEAAFQLNDIYQRHGRNGGLEFLENILYITQKHNKYKRFNYIKTFFSWKYGSDFLKTEHEKSSRLYSQKLKLFNTEHPNMPLLEYSNDYKSSNHIEILRLEAKFCIIAGKYEIAEQIMDKIFYLLNNEDTYKTVLLNEGHYQNIIVAKLYNKKFREAWNYSEDFYNWLKNNAPTDRAASAHFMKAQILLASYPNLPIKDFNSIIDALTQWIYKFENKRENNSNLIRKFLLAKLLFINKEYNAALKQLSSNDLKLYIQHASDYSLYHELFQIAASNTFDNISNYKLKLERAIFKTENSVVRSDYEWLLRVAKELCNVQ